MGHRSPADLAYIRATLERGTPQETLRKSAAALRAADLAIAGGSVPLARAMAALEGRRNES